MENEITNIIETKINNLPLADAAVFEIIQMLDNSDSNVEQIMGKLSPGVAAKFLETANTAYYGQNIQTIKRAIMVLGYRGMKQVLTTSVLLYHFPEKDVARCFNFRKFKEHALFCASISKALGETVNYLMPDDLFTVSMLHNLGKFIIAVYFPDEYAKINALKESRNISSSEAERKVLGISHEEISGFILKRFHGPEYMCNAIRFHHSKDRTIQEETNFELEVILRESVNLIDSFVLPEETRALKIEDRLKAIVEEGRKFFREEIRDGMRDTGYLEIFVPLIKQVSGMVYEELKEIFQERVYRQR